MDPDEVTTPPGSLPLVEGLGSEWNDIVSAFPEDRRAELGPKIKERISSYEPLKQWEDLHKSGITPEEADTALRIYTTLENNPKEFYDTLAKALGITPTEAKEVIKEVESSDDSDPRIAKLQNQIDTMSQILLAQRQMESQEKTIAAQEAALEKDISAVKKKYGNDIPEDEILMRMAYKGMTAEQAYEEYANNVSQIRSKRPAPMILGSGGTVPSRAIDPKTLNNEQTKSLVVQMMQAASSER